MDKYKEELRREYNLETYGKMIQYDRDKLWKWFFSKLEEKQKEIERLEYWNREKKAEVDAEALSVVVAEAEQGFRIDHQNAFDALKVENYDLKYDIERLQSLLLKADTVIDSISFEPTMNGSVFKPRNGYAKLHEALEAYTTEKENK